MLSTYGSIGRSTMRASTSSSPIKPSPRLWLPLSKSVPTAPAPQPPCEPLALKQFILQQHPAKLFSFSLAHMRKIAVPPVEIPRAYRAVRAAALTVGGHRVPYTRAMWATAKRRVVRRSLDRIHENVVYD